MTMINGAVSEAAPMRDKIRNEIINTPETADFMAGVPIEAEHQRQRWGADHDTGKGPLDWFWLIGYLSQKAADAAIRGDAKKAKHHTISTAAALANWHCALSGGANEMRPGIDNPEWERVTDNTAAPTREDEMQAMYDDPAFVAAWSKMEAKGYIYGDDALEQVYLGWKLAHTARPDAASFQSRVQPWMMACFGEVIAGDREERNHRFLEEALELVQACGCTVSEAHQLVDYVYARPIGDPAQEVGGVMVTLAALCLANGLNMHADAEIELARIWTKVEEIRAKQAAKPKHSPLPQDAASSEIPIAWGNTLAEELKKLQASFKPIFDEQAAEWAEHGPAAMASFNATGATLNFIGGNCPVQAEGTVDGLPFYFRARGHAWSFEVGLEETWHGRGAWCLERDYGAWPDAGWMSQHEAIGFIVAAISEYRSTLANATTA